MRSIGVAVVLPLLASCSVYYQPDPGPTAGLLPDARAGEGERFRTLARSCVDARLAADPVSATGLGVHDYDAWLGVWSREAIEGRAAAIREQQSRLASLDRSSLGPEDLRVDLLIEHGLRAEAYEIETVRAWERDPRFYRRLVEEGLRQVATGSEVAADKRMERTGYRLGQVPRILERARENLKDPPRYLVDLAAAETEALAGWVRTGLSETFKDVAEPVSRARFLVAQPVAAEALASFAEWLKTSLRPHAVDGVALGEARLTEWLRVKAGLEGTVDEFLARAAADPGGPVGLPLAPLAAGRTAAVFGCRALDAAGMTDLRPAFLRWRAVLEIHGHGMPVEGAAGLLVREGLSEAEALREARLAAAEPLAMLQAPAAVETRRLGLGAAYGPVPLSLAARLDAEAR